MTVVRIQFQGLCCMYSICQKKYKILVGQRMVSYGNIIVSSGGLNTPSAREYLQEAFLKFWYTI